MLVQLLYAEGDMLRATAAITAAARRIMEEEL